MALRKPLANVNSAAVKSGLPRFNAKGETTVITAPEQSLAEPAKAPVPAPAPAAAAAAAAAKRKGADEPVKAGVKQVKTMAATK